MRWRRCLPAALWMALAMVLLGGARPALALTGTQEPLMSANYWCHTYAIASGGSRSALERQSDGTYQRAEYTDEDDSPRLVVETYSPDYEFVSGFEIPISELSDTLQSASDFDPKDVIWGGLYCGSTYNYVATGFANRAESDSAPIIQLTQFTKDWRRNNVLTIFGSNTSIPFFWGNCRFAEDGNRLVMRTCHLMYTTDDMLQHQASMVFVFDQTPLRQVDQEYDIATMGHSLYGYVSHSFNQYVLNYQGEFYSLDHGDSHPRAAAIKHMGMEDAWHSYWEDVEEPPSYREIFEFSGEIGNNVTWATVDGFESSQAANTLLALGTSYDQSDPSNSRTCNVWLSVVDPDLTSHRTMWLTNYAEGGPKCANSPYIVKLSENRFLVVWGVRSLEDDGSYATRSNTIEYVFIDGQGNVQGSVQNGKGRLSDCEPIVCGNRVVWYVTGIRESENGSDRDVPTAPVFHSIDITTGQLESSENLWSLDVSLAHRNDPDVYRFTGSPVMPQLSVTDDGRELVEGVDYEVEVANNVNAGEATYTIVGKGAYRGERSDQFLIFAVPLYGFDGSCFRYLSKSSPQLMPQITMTMGDYQLIQGVDFEIANYEISPGGDFNDYRDRMRIDVEGTGNFTGETTFWVELVEPVAGQEPDPQEPAAAVVPIWRLYNPTTGEHLYTMDRNEYDTLGRYGWKQESAAFKTPTYSGVPVYRLFNPYTDDHHYTTDLGEAYNLSSQGWKDEGIVFYADAFERCPVYRLFNPYATKATHLYTTSESEYNSLASSGWRQEAIGWYSAA